MLNLSELLAATEESGQSLDVERTDNRGRKAIWLPAIQRVLENKEPEVVLVFAESSPPEDWSPTKTHPDYNAITQAGLKRTYAQKVIDDNEYTNDVFVSVKRAPKLDDETIVRDKSGRVIFDGYMVVLEPK